MSQDMTKDEVLVFRQFHHDTTATGAKPLQTVFHSAFKHPKAGRSLGVPSRRSVPSWKW